MLSGCIHVPIISSNSFSLSFLVTEGLALYKIGVSPYSGDIFHQVGFYLFVLIPIIFVELITLFFPDAIDA